MRLHSNPASPFGRKVKVLAHRDRAVRRSSTFIRHRPRPVGPDPSLVADNPLGKIPCLVLADGSRTLRFPGDLRVSGHAARRATHVPARRAGTMGRAAAAIAGRRHHRCGAAGPLRDLPASRAAALARLDRWAARQGDRGLDRIEAVEASSFGERLDIGVITVACAVGYLDFRFPGIAWRTTRPTLAAWYEQFATRPSMLATKPPG